MRPMLTYGRHTLEDDDVEAVATALRRPLLTQGPTVEAFEDALRGRVGAPYAVAVNSGTAALQLGVLALGTRPGDVGIVPAVTFVATANALLHAGARVAFADVDPATGLLSVDSAMRAVNTARASGLRCRVVIPVHLNGQPADLPAIWTLARSVGASVLEDAAHALGATYVADGRTHAIGSCAHSDAAILSFHPVKHITTAEGGALLCRDEDAWRRAVRLRGHGIERDARRQRPLLESAWLGPWYYEQQEVGFNFRIPDVLCALGLRQLTRLDLWVRRRREIARRYEEALRRPPLQGVLEGVASLPDRESSYHLFVVRVVGRSGERVEEIARRRRDLFEHLVAGGILPQVHYVPVPWQPIQRARAWWIDRLDGAMAYYASCLSLPCHPTLSEDDQARVLERLEQWASRT